MKESKLESSLISGLNIKILDLSRNAGGSFTGGTALCPSARHIDLYLELVQPRKTHPNITEKMLTGSIRIKSSKQIKIASLWRWDRKINIFQKLFPDIHQEYHNG